MLSCKILIVPVLLIASTCNMAQNTNPLSQQEIIETYVKNGAWKCCDMYSQEWQDKIDEGLAIDSTVAYLWQQKAMPLFKLKKYDEGMRFLNNAVLYDRESWLPYRAFMKCIFSREYVEAIDDFEKSKAMHGNQYIMDHSYNTYIAMCYLQLKNFTDAEQVLTSEINSKEELNGRDWVHHLDLFYLGVAKYELQKYDESIEVLNWALEIYPQFSDAGYYKGLALMRTGQIEAGENCMAKAKKYFDSGYTINEDNSLYELYPYQVIWNH